MHRHKLDWALVCGKVLLNNPDWPQTQDPHASAAQVKELQVCCTERGSWYVCVCVRAARACVYWGFSLCF